MVPFTEVRDNKCKQHSLNKKGKFITLWLTACIFLISVGTAMAQAPEDPSPLDPAVPVDGGLSLLIAAGTVYGAGRIRGKRD